MAKKILVHGSGHKAASWKETVSCMDGKEDLLCPDLCALLAGKTASYPSLYGAFAEYCDHVGRAVHLCGLSLGGILALNYALDFPEKTDLITSCSTLQWFNDPKEFFARCHRFLSEDGYLAFSTFGTENMREIRTLTGHGLDYLPIEALKELLAPHFETVYAEEEIVSLPFSTPLQVLQHLKETGVTGTEKKVWTRGRLQTFCNSYTEQFRREDGNVTLTYHPIYIVTRRKKIKIYK